MDIKGFLIFLAIMGILIGLLNSYLNRNKPIEGQWWSVVIPFLIGITIFIGLLIAKTVRFFIELLIIF